MTLAIDVIATNGQISTGAAADLLIAYELATGTVVGGADFTVTEEVDWSDLPLGAGCDLIAFAQSLAYRNLPDEKTYGDVARAWLNYRLAHFKA
jgi:hypothetical protein